MGLVGPGCAAQHHINAVRRIADVAVIAIAGSSEESVSKRAHELKVQASSDHYQELIDAPRVQVIHNTTPNALH